MSKALFLFNFGDYFKIKKNNGEQASQNNSANIITFALPLITWMSVITIYINNKEKSINKANVSETENC